MGRLDHMLIHTGEKSYLRQPCGVDFGCHVSMRGMPLSCMFCWKFLYAIIIISDYIEMCNANKIEPLKYHKLNYIIYCQCECFTERPLNYAGLCENQSPNIIKLTAHMRIHTEEIRITTISAEYNNQSYKIEVSNAMVFTVKLHDHTEQVINDSDIILWHAILTLKCMWMPFSCTICDITPIQIYGYTTFQGIHIQTYYCTKWDKWLLDILDYLKCRYKI